MRHAQTFIATANGLHSDRVVGGDGVDPGHRLGRSRLYRVRPGQPTFRQRRPGGHRRAAQRQQHGGRNGLPTRLRIIFTGGKDAAGNTLTDFSGKAACSARSLNSFSSLMITTPGSW